MKRIFITILISTAFMSAFGQKLSKDQSSSVIVYDSLTNFLGRDVEKYLGQELLLKGLPKESRSFGYTGFLLKYKKDDDLLNDRKNIYKPNDEYSSRYEDLNGKHFVVLEIIKHPKAKKNEAEYGDDFYLKLQEKESGDVVYYKYNIDSEYTFPFLVTGFIDKQKQLLIGNSYVITDDILKMSRDLSTGKAVVFTTGQKWKCMDLTIDNDDSELSLIIQNPSGKQILIPYSLLNSQDGIQKVYTASEADSYKKKFNVNNFNRILQNKVRVGMTKDMCRLAWGEPAEKKEILSGKRKNEVWIYPAGSLTFRGNNLVGMK